MDCLCYYLSKRRFYISFSYFPIRKIINKPCKLNSFCVFILLAYFVSLTQPCSPSLFFVSVFFFFMFCYLLQILSTQDKRSLMIAREKKGLAMITEVHLQIALLWSNYFILVNIDGSYLLLNEERSSLIFFHLFLELMCCLKQQGIY